MKLSLVLILTGTFLTSLEIIFGETNLINFFANKIRFQSNKYANKLNSFMLREGILNHLFSRIGIVL
ncbi:MAG: hypothetical protein LUQ20_08960, partial [Candidatus Methanoperedens sp.]|nr:hypothetical protein [Candidatus Methanoperedens sp.]